MRVADPAYRTLTQVAPRDVVRRIVQEARRQGCAVYYDSKRTKKGRRSYVKVKIPISVPALWWTVDLILDHRWCGPIGNLLNELKGTDTFETYTPRFGLGSRCGYDFALRIRYE